MSIVYNKTIGFCLPGLFFTEYTRYGWVLQNHPKENIVWLLKQVFYTSIFFLSHPTNSIRLLNECQLAEQVQKSHI